MMARTMTTPATKPIPIEYRPMRDPAQETARVSHIITRAFGGPEDRVPKWLERLGHTNVRLVEATMPGAKQRHVHGTLLFISMGQYFGGRSVPMIGIAGVAVSPEARGRGVATAMMEHALREIHAMGAPISTLYPATQPLYRRVGFEQAGSRFEHRVETSMIRVRERSLASVPMGDSERAEARRLYAKWAVHCDGALDRPDYIWARVHQPMFQQADGYLLVGASGAEGYVVQAPMTPPPPGSGAERGDLFCTDVCALTPAAARAILTHLAEHDSRIAAATFHGPAWHPVTAIMDEQSYHVRLLDHWMVRIVDVPKALEARGYPPGLSLSLTLEVHDTLIPSNGGRFEISVEGGRARVKRGGSGGIRLEIRDLAPLYAGFATPWALRLMGRLEGDEDSLTKAAAMFAGAGSAMSDMF